MNTLEILHNGLRILRIPLLIFSIGINTFLLYLLIDIADPIDSQYYHPEHQGIIGGLKFVIGTACAISAILIIIFSIADFRISKNKISLINLFLGILVLILSLIMF